MTFSKSNLKGEKNSFELEREIRNTVRKLQEFYFYGDFVFGLVGRQSDYEDSTAFVLRCSMSLTSSDFPMTLATDEDSCWMKASSNNSLAMFVLTRRCGITMT